MSDLISRQAAIDEIEYELEMINSALDPITLDFNARERLRQRRGEAREILNSIQQLPSVQPEVTKCRDCKFYTPLNRETKTGICSLLIHQNFGDDWYCAGAERRTDERDKT